LATCKGTALQISREDDLDRLPEQPSTPSIRA
jgi:hypothetical protein